MMIWESYIYKSHELLFILGSICCKKQKMNTVKSLY